MNAAHASVMTATQGERRRCAVCAAGEERSDNLLVISSSPEDRLMLAFALRSNTCPQRWVSSCREATDWSRRVAPRVVICDENLRDGSWRDVWMRFRFADSPPVFIVAAAFADERLWAEALNLGAYDVLSKPFLTVDVQNSLRNACRSFLPPAKER